jgi:hypothetical protein
MQIDVEKIIRPVSVLPGAVAGKLVLAVYAATLFISAGLLFVVEPMISKMALPRLGGSPQVWTTCLFFFQAALLLGYSYAHVLVRISGRIRQIAVHAMVIAAVSYALPLKFIVQTTPPSASPVWWLIERLSITVGAPFFAIAATTPLLQQWFSQIRHPASRDPYFLYGASNLGSLLALVAYPLVIEPNLSLDTQSHLWSQGFVLLALGLTVSAAAFWMFGRAPKVEAKFPTTIRTFTLLDHERLLWIALAFVPSSLLLGVTAHITTDVAAAPLFWVVPLALYLLSFVLTFSRRSLVPYAALVRVLPVFVIPVVLFGPPLALPISTQFLLHLGCFFIIALVSHGELARRRPDAVRLTEFYFCLSLGGVLGGLFNAIVAPALFPDIWEYPLVLILACLIAPKAEEDRKPGLAYDLILPASLLVFLLLSRSISTPMWLVAGQPHLVRFAGFVAYLLPALAMMSFRRRRLRFALGVGVCALIPALTSPYQTLLTARSFFGVYRVSLVDGGSARTLLHGTTIHGAESLVPGEQTMPTSYYSSEGPFGRFFAALAARDHPLRNVGIIGLGTGTLACYASPGQHWTFYEIDPLIESIARDQRLFQFMARCGKDAHVITGDARLTLNGAPDGSYDALVIDAFSSDSIPIHLLTQEALGLYFRKLAPHGVILFHVSNMYLDLAPVISALASSAGARARYLSYQPSETNSSWRIMPANVIAVALPGDDLDFLTQDAGWVSPPTEPGTALWTDQRSDLLRTIRWLF